MNVRSTDQEFAAVWPMMDAVFLRNPRPPAEFKKPPMPPRAKAILAEMVSEYGLTEKELLGREDGRLPYINNARSTLYYRLIAAGYSYPRVGGFACGRGHDCIFKAVRRYEKRTGKPRVGKRHRRAQTVKESWTMA